MEWLLDTNILSELRKLRPDRNVIAWVSRQPLKTLHVSAVTFAEIRYGIEIVQDATFRFALESWLANSLRPMFAGRILPITEDVMLRWRLMVAEGRKRNHTFSQPDLIIGATAMHYGLTVVTRNVRDFDVAGVPVVNPWITPASP